MAVCDRARRPARAALQSTDLKARVGGRGGDRLVTTREGLERENRTKYTAGFQRRESFIKGKFRC